MSRLTDLIASVKASSPELGEDLNREFKALSSRLHFGLNFERHRPEAVELPLRKIRKGDKVRILPPRGTTKKGDQSLWRVKDIQKVSKEATLELINHDQLESKTAVLDDLVVVSEFRDTIYPGLVSTGKVVKGDNKPFHTVINGENFHALKALTFTHRGKVDVIYIDPPYNSGAKDWKYNNNYVDKDDQYRHSKWLSMLERRLVIAKQLLNNKDSILIVSIDEKEYLRLGLLLEQTFPEAKVQMVTTLINPKGVARGQEFYRVDEYIYFVFFGDVQLIKLDDSMILTGKENENSEIDTESEQEPKVTKVRWGNLLRSGQDAQREDRKHQFYPIFVDDKTGKIKKIGEPLLPVTEDRYTIIPPVGTIAIWPIRKDGSEGRWSVGHEYFDTLYKKGYAYEGAFKGDDRLSFSYITKNTLAQIESGTIRIRDRVPNGPVVLEYVDESNIAKNPKTMWNKSSHSASEYGSTLLRDILPGRTFPFPKSLYAVEDALKFFVKNKPNAIILDFFAGSGTTAHAVMKINKEDGGHRQCISITNNEVSYEEQSKLKKKGYRPGDDEWERLGICDYITKPRIAACINGKTPEGKAIRGDYKFTDEFPIADGFQENAEFFTLTYEDEVEVNHNFAFKRVAPLLWLRAGAIGGRIDRLPNEGWSVVETYGVLTELDQANGFIQAIQKSKAIKIAYIVTDDDRRFQTISKRLPKSVEPVRLYESYITNFSFANEE